MNRKISAILKYFSPGKLKEDRRVIVFFICLLIAVALWFLNALGKDYSATLSYPVKYVNPPKELFLANTPPSKFDLKVHAHGFTLLRHKLTFSLSPLVVDLSELSRSSGELLPKMEISSNALIKKMSAQISKEINIDEISPQSITLTFDNLKSKKVPVIPDIKMEFKAQHYLNGEATAEPESLKITGPAHIIDTILYLKTKFQAFTNLDSKTEKAIAVVHPENTTLSEEKITLTFPVEEFTEKEVSVPIGIVNYPENIELKLFPSHVSVSFLVAFSEYENVTSSDFSATVDYNETLSGSSTLDVVIESINPFIHSVRVSPASVEYLVETEN